VEALARRRRLVELARRGVERARRLAGADAGSKAELDAAQETLAQRRLALIEQRRTVNGFESRIERLEAQRAQARARFEQAERDRRRSTIDTPFDARIADVEVAPGDRVRPGDPMVRLFDPARLEIRAILAGTDIAPVRRALATGQPLRARIALGGDSVAGELDRLSGRTPEDAGGVQALFRLTGQAPPAPALGQFAEIELVLPPQPNVAAVPFSALYGGERVYGVRDGRMHAIEIERVGQRSRVDGPSQALVRSPELADGERIVTTQLARAMDGLPVEVRAPPEPRR
jgi:multidrug efflux pump subunit AcrA (membrane-fusion protein)